MEGKTIEHEESDDSQNLNYMQEGSQDDDITY